MKKVLLVVSIVSFLFCFTGFHDVFALEKEDLELIEPTVDLDLVVIRTNQSKTVAADLRFPLDFQLIPVALIGKGALRVTLSKTDTHGELVYIYLLGFDTPHTDFNVGVTPVSLTVSSTNGLLDYNIGLVITGVLFSLEEPPYDYNVSFSF